MQTAAKPRTRRRSLKIGIDLLAAEGTMQGETPRWADMRSMAETAEAVGFDSIWVPDHLLLPAAFMNQPGKPADPIGNWECWTMLSGLAAATTRVELGTLVLGGGYRNPALLAKMAETIDEISGGRLILGLGSGWTEFEYRAFGYPYDHRVSRFEEAVQIIRSLLKDGYVDFDGRFYQARECEMRPRGPRPSGPPIMIGSRSPRMHRLAAKYADVWNGAWSSSVQEMAPMLDAIDEACQEVGRNPDTLTRTAGVLVSFPGDFPEREDSVVWQQMHARTTLTGSYDEIAAGLLGYLDGGVSHIQVILDPMTAEHIEEFGNVLEKLDSMLSVTQPA
jgi:probable F420-dependent oxidoreductase